MLKTHNFELYEHLQTRLFTNMTGVPYCSQSHDARHEEANKKAQNMLPGNSLSHLEIVLRLTCILTLGQKVSANMRDFRHFKNRDKSPHFKENAHIAQ